MLHRGIRDYLEWTALSSYPPSLRLTETLRICLLAISHRYPKHSLDINEAVLGPPVQVPGRPFLEQDAVVHNGDAVARRHRRVRMPNIAISDRAQIASNSLAPADRQRVSASIDRLRLEGPRPSGPPQVYRVRGGMKLQVADSSSLGEDASRVQVVGDGALGVLPYGGIAE